MNKLKTSFLIYLALAEGPGVARGKKIKKKILKTFNFFKLIFLTFNNGQLVCPYADSPFKH